MEAKEKIGEMRRERYIEREMGEGERERPLSEAGSGTPVSG